MVVTDEFVPVLDEIEVTASAFQTMLFIAKLKLVLAHGEFRPTVDMVRAVIMGPFQYLVGTSRRNIKKKKRCSSGNVRLLLNKEKRINSPVMKQVSLASFGRVRLVEPKAVCTSVLRKPVCAALFPAGKLYKFSNLSLVEMIISSKQSRGVNAQIVGVFLYSA